MPKKTNEKNLNKLTRLFAVMDEDSLTRKEFTENFKRILDFLKSLKEKNQGEFKVLNKSISEQSEKLKGDNTTSISTLKEEFKKIVNKALKDQEDGMNFIRDKVRSLKSGDDGKDADEKKIVEKVLGQIKLPEQKELDTAQEIRDKLEALKGKEKLRMSATIGTRIHVGKEPPKNKKMLWVQIL